MEFLTLFVICNLELIQINQSNQVNQLIFFLCCAWGISEIPLVDECNPHLQCLETTLGTMFGGQFDWGGSLQKGNAGAQGLAQRGWTSRSKGKAISQLDCESDGSSRDESRSQ